MARWRHALQEAFGPYGELLVSFVPRLELIVGPQPPVGALTGVNSKRFGTMANSSVRGQTKRLPD